MLKKSHLKFIFPTRQIKHEEARHSKFPTSRFVFFFPFGPSIYFYYSIL